MVQTDCCCVERGLYQWTLEGQRDHDAEQEALED